MLHLHNYICLEACSAITIAPAEWTRLLHFLGCSFRIPDPVNNVLDQNIHQSAQCQESTYNDANNHKIILRKLDITSILQRYEEWWLDNQKTTISDFHKIPIWRHRMAS